MSDILIHRVDTRALQRPKVRAKRNGRSLQGEAKLILEMPPATRCPMREFYLPRREFYLPMREFYLRMRESKLPMREFYLRRREFYLPRRESKLRRREFYLRMREFYLPMREKYFRMRESNLRMREINLRMRGINFRMREINFRMRETYLRMREINFRMREIYFRMREINFRMRELKIRVYWRITRVGRWRGGESFGGRYFFESVINSPPGQVDEFDKPRRLVDWPVGQSVWWANLVRSVLGRRPAGCGLRSGERTFMGHGYLPITDAGLLAWTNNFLLGIQDTPTAVGLTTVQVSAYDLAYSEWRDKLAAAVNPSTRGTLTVFAKNEIKKQIISISREYAAIVQAFPGTTDEQRVSLGLTVRKSPAPIPAPDFAPSMDIVSVNGRTITVRLHDGSPNRAKPAGVAGATVLSYIGQTAPDEMGGWKFEGGTTRTMFEVSFSPTLEPGATVWLAAFWTNPREKSGPACTPVSVTFGAAALNKSGTLKLAA